MPIHYILFVSIMFLAIFNSDVSSDPVSGSIIEYVAHVVCWTYAKTSKCSLRLYVLSIITETSTLEKNTISDMNFNYATCEYWYE